MWQKELNDAISKKQPVTIRLKDGEVMQGLPEQCSDLLKLRKDYEVIWVTTVDIEHVSRLIQLQLKKDPTSN